ncbi:MAG TPA: hypothetical protein VM008_14550 [Phycisphaerae bacterium]|nr:hypothetical protein [Phycisphaerae bacterium]
MSMRRAGAVGFLVAAAMGMGGCQAWNGWLDLWRFPTGEGKKELAGAGGSGGMPGTSQEAKDLAALPARMVVYRITLPVGTFSGNEKVWSQLNEDALDSKTTVLLAQNGLRAATGPLGRWPAISKLIDVPGAMTDQMVCQTDGSSAVNVVTRANIADQNVVSVDRDLEQQGRTFNRCDDGFRLSMRKTGMSGKGGGASGGAAQLMVQLEPVVTEGSGGAVGGGGMGNIGAGAFTSEESFPDLQMAATLRADQFFVVSPGDPRGNRFSVGSLWLSDLAKAPAVETVLVFVPVMGTPPKK